MGARIVYFHGYASSPGSAKVDALRAIEGADVHAFPIDIDPDIAVESLSDRIDMILLDNPEGDDPWVFVGTSLGAWWASKMGRLYGIDAFLINPCFEPRVTLAQYNVPTEILDKYEPLVVRPKRDVYFFAEVDDVIPNAESRAAVKAAGAECHIDPEGDHRFGGAPFDRVVTRIASCRPPVN